MTRRPAIAEVLSGGGADRSGGRGAILITGAIDGGPGTDAPLAGNFRHFVNVTDTASLAGGIGMAGDDVMSDTAGAAQMFGGRGFDSLTGQRAATCRRTGR